MGQLVTTVAGGVLGFMIGGPLGAQIGMMAGGLVGSTLFGPTVHGPRLNDLKVTASVYGTAIPEIYGTVRVAGNLLWSTGIRETKKTSRQGKGGPKQTTYSYDATFAMALCKGPIDGVLRIWCDNKLVYNSAYSSRSPSNLGEWFRDVWITMLAESMGKEIRKNKLKKLRVYLGTEDQLPDSLIVADKGAGNVSAYRGLAYVVVENLELEDFGNRIPQMTFEITKAKIDTVASIPAKNPDTTNANTQGREWLADFSTDRLLSFATGGTGVWSYDLNAMTETTRNSSLDVDLNNRGFSIVPGTNRMIVGDPPVEGGAGFAVYNTVTLSVATQHCERGGTNNSYHEPTDTVFLAPSGRIGHGRYATATGAGMHIVHCDWQGNLFLMTPSGELIDRVKAPFSPHLFLEGKTNGATSQIIGWRPANDRLEAYIVGISAAAAHTVIDDMGTLVWVPDTRWDANQLNLKPFPDEAFSPLVLLYDPTDDHLFCLGQSASVVTVFKYSLSTGAYKFIEKHPSLALPGDSVQRMRSSRIAGGTFGWASRQGGASSITTIDLQTGKVERTIPLGGEFASKLNATGQQIWDDTSGSLLIGRDNNTEFYRLLIRDGVGMVSLATVVEDICLRGRVLTPADIDTSQLKDEEITGYLIDRECSSRDALKQLATGYLFDCYESDYMIRFRSRGNESQLTISEDWIGRDTDGEVVRETVTQELELPLKITINHYDISRDHQQGTQSAKRNANPYPTMWTRKEDIMELPLVWTPDDAKRCADKLLKMAWANRTNYQFNLPWRFLKCDPTDVLTVTLESGTTYNMRLTSLDAGANFSIETRAVSERATAYVSDAVGNPGKAPVQGIEGDGTAFPIVVNTPLLRDDDYRISGSSICYLSAGTNQSRFSGTVIFMNDGIEFQPIAGIDGTVVSGYAVNALPVNLAYEATDETTVLRVRLSDPQMELESITQEDMLNTSANAALVGEEIIQFRNAEQQMNGEWWLTGLLRARRGTNYAIRNHEPGERFLLLDVAAMGAFRRPPESYVTTRTFKAASAGTLLTDATPHTVDLVPRDLMPYTPEDVRITDDGTTVTLTMQRRSRITAPLANGYGNIHYKEGDKITGRIAYKMWSGLGVADAQTMATPTLEGTLPLFDVAGDDLPLVITFPLTAIGAEPRFLIRLAELGEVEGTPKWVEFERTDTGDWNKTELY